jgi:hypothetical protein
MVSGTFKSSPSHEGAVRKFAAPAQAMLKQNFRTETILESCIFQHPRSPKFAKTPLRRQRISGSGRKRTCRIRTWAATVTVNQPCLIGLGMN